MRECTASNDGAEALAEHIDVCRELGFNKVYRFFDDEGLQ